MEFYIKSAKETFEILKTDASGLTGDEASRRLAQNGKNELAKAKRKNLFIRFTEQLVNPMVLILLAAAAVSVFIAAFGSGHVNDYAEAGIILAVVILNSALGVFQESKAEKAIEALREMSAATAKVRRGGAVMQINAGGLVTGDIVLIEAGDSVPADMRLIWSASLRIDEAALTGESVPVGKQTEALHDGYVAAANQVEAPRDGFDAAANQVEALCDGYDAADKQVEALCDGYVAAVNQVEALQSGAATAGKQSEVFSAGKGEKVPLGDRKNMAYMGTSATYGRGEGVVTSTGMDTEIGKIAAVILGARDSETPLQKRLSQLSKILSALVLGICLVIFTVRIIGADAVNADVIMSSFMLAVSLAVAAIPEGLAAVVTIVLSIGVTNMAKRGAIIRRLTAVETLGCAQVICSDKTGTLTQNKMTVVESFGDTKLVAKAMALCSDSQVSLDGAIIGDPTENALITFAQKEGFDINALGDEYPRAAEAPFDSFRKMMTTLHRVPDGCGCGKLINDAPDGYIQFTKGAPDEVLRVCTHVFIDGQIVALSPQIAGNISSINSGYADRALRVLACAFKDWGGIAPPIGFEPRNIENGLTFIGLCAMTDPVRPEVKTAMESCMRSGIKVVMITGDHRDTAAAIAKELGMITNTGQAVTGRELENLSDTDFEGRVEDIRVYARVQPEHKVRIVDMWKRKGFVTAMTGDGVNDAPAVKSGDIGVGMGITGTDVTKNVADMVLADDNFATIVSAVEEGRRIFDNIKKTIQFLLGSNLSEVFSIFVATLMGFTLFKPVHLLFINLITDSLPAVALGMERAQPGIMERPPRGKNEGVFSGGIGFDLMYQGALIAALTLISYFVTDIWHDHGTAMTAAFLTMSMCELFHAFNVRTQRQSIFTLKYHNKALWGAMFISLILSLAVIYVPALSGVFSLEPLTARELFVALALSISIIPLVEAVKAVQRALGRGITA